MKHLLILVLALMLASGCALPPAQDHRLPSVRLTGHDKDGDTVTVRKEGHRTVVDVRSRTGTGRAELTCPDRGWRRPVGLRLHFHALEGLHVNNGKVSVHTSLLSHPPYEQLCELFPAGESNGSSLEKSSPFWMPLHVENKSAPGQRVIPLAAGYFEVTIPEALLDNRPEPLQIQWIDWYRK